MSDYPSDRKKSGYAIRYIKALTGSDAIRSVGMESVLLCVFIASREDRLHYSKPPQFWRAELMERLGIGSPKALIRIRKAAVDAGLLYHVEGDRIHPGKYWTMVPNWLLPTFVAFRKRNGKKLTRSGNGTGSGTANGTANGTLSITQYPVPSTDKERTPSALALKGKSKAKFDPLLIDLPEPLQTDQFRTAWGQWVAHRKEIKKPITPTMAETQLKQFAQWGQARASTAILHTIAKGWQGIREPEQQATNQASQPQPQHQKKQLTRMENRRNG